MPITNGTPIISAGFAALMVMTDRHIDRQGDHATTLAIGHILGCA